MTFLFYFICFQFRWAGSIFCPLHGNFWIVVAVAIAATTTTSSYIDSVFLWIPPVSFRSPKMEATEVSFFSA